jgi:hypothetical protein
MADYFDCPVHGSHSADSMRGECTSLGSTREMADLRPDLVHLHLEAARQPFVPRIEPGADAFDVQRATVPEGRVGVFVMTVPADTHPDTLWHIEKGWSRVWIDAGLPRAPGLFVLPEGMSLMPLSDADLQNLGLMRIPAEQAK